MSNFKDRDILTGTYLLIVGRGAFHNLGLQACTSFVALEGGDKVIVREACFRRVIAWATIEIQIRVVAQESPQLAQGHLVGRDRVGHDEDFGEARDRSRRVSK